MLTYVFLVCAVVGGAILVVQFVMTLAGLGGEGFDIDVDVPDSMDFDTGHFDVGDGDAVHHDSSWFFGIISFRTVVAAITFFGLCGMLARSTGVGSAPFELLIGLIGGVVAMYAVYWMMASLKKLSEDGTLRINSAIGKIGTVYISIPPNKTAPGKIQVKVQDRLVEFAAVTSGDDKLLTGAKVEVVGVIGQDTLEVSPVHETISSTDAK